MEIPGTLQLQANVLHLALVATKGTEIVDKVMRNSWKDRPPFPFKGTAILSAACSPMTSFHTETQATNPCKVLCVEDG